MKERLNWREACEVLGCSKSTLYRLVANGQLRAFGVGSRGRWYSRTECELLLLSKKEYFNMDCEKINHQEGRL